MTPRGDAAIADILNGKQATEQRVRLKMPKLAENGLSVPVEIQVESPMTASDHIRAVHLVAPVNPTPLLARFSVGPYSGEVHIRTRVRLADSQTVFAYAQSSDGSIWLGRASVVVTLGGCVDPVL